MTKYLICFTILISVAITLPAEQLRTGFTYQGDLSFGGSPANGSFDFQFELFDVATDGATIAAPVIVENHAVSDGMFVVNLDFGMSPYTGEQLWLEIRVRESTDSSPHTILSPRQSITPAPYALFAQSVDTELIQARVTGNCEPGSFMTGINAGGGVICIDPDNTSTPGVDCSMEAVDIKMFWASCDGNLDCYEAVDPANGLVRRWLRLPSAGPVAKVAHLVTAEDDFGGGWPTSFTDGIAQHYVNSEAASGFDTNRTEPWNPAGEGGSEFGQGATGAPVPVLDEAWYITMFWRDRPVGGTRMIVVNQATGDTVVASAGYNTGPGANSTIAGVAEEIHHALGTTHLSELHVGFANDQTLSLGPTTCL